MSAAAISAPAGIAGYGEEAAKANRAAARMRNNSATKRAIQTIQFTIAGTTRQYEYRAEVKRLDAPQDIVY